MSGRRNRSGTPGGWLSRGGSRRAPTMTRRRKWPLNVLFRRRDFSRVHAMRAKAAMRRSSGALQFTSVNLFIERFAKRTKARVGRPTQGSRTKHARRRHKRRAPRSKHARRRHKRRAPRSKHARRRHKRRAPRSKHARRRHKRSAPRSKHARRRHKRRAPRSKHARRHHKRWALRSKHARRRHKRRAPRSKHARRRHKRRAPRTKHRPPRYKRRGRRTQSTRVSRRYACVSSPVEMYVRPLQREARGERIAQRAGFIVG
jgi:hypothetical protein